MYGICWVPIYKMFQRIWKSDKPMQLGIGNSKIEKNKEIPTSSSTKKLASPGNRNETQKRTPVTSQNRTSPKKRRVLQETDDKFVDTDQNVESKDNGGSVFIGPEDKSEDDDDDISMMVTFVSKELFSAWM